MPPGRLIKPSLTVPWEILYYLATRLSTQPAQCGTKQKRGRPSRMAGPQGLLQDPLGPTFTSHLPQTPQSPRRPNPFESAWTTNGKLITSCCSHCQFTSQYSRLNDSNTLSHHSLMQLHDATMTMVLIFLKRSSHCSAQNRQWLLLTLNESRHSRRTFSSELDSSPTLFLYRSYAWATWTNGIYPNTPTSFTPEPGCSLPCHRCHYFVTEWTRPTPLFSSRQAPSGAWTKFQFSSCAPQCPLHGGFLGCKTKPK